MRETGGGDFPECYELVLHDAQSLSWTFDEADNAENGARKSTMKALVIIGDAPPHEDAPKGWKWREELDVLQA